MLKGNKISANNYLIKQLPKATAFINKSKQIVYASDQWVNDFAFSSDTVIGKNVNELFKNQNKQWRNLLMKRFEDNTTQPFVEHFLDKDGNEKWFEVQNIPWHDDKENVVGSIIQTENVTKRISDDGKLEKLQIISEQMSDVAQIGFWDYNLKNDKMFWCDRTRAIYQVTDDYEPNIIDATNFFKNGYSRNTLSMIVNKAITSETPFHEKLQLVTTKGEELWVIVSGKPVYRNGIFTGLIGTIQDINKLNLAEIKTRENEHLLRTLIDNLPLNVFIKDLESRKILVNKAEAEFCGVADKSELIGKDDFAFYDRETAESFRIDDLQVMRNLQPILGREMPHTKKDGSITTFLTSKIPLIDTDGHAYGLVGISMDISDLKQKELELRKLIEVTSSQNEKLVNFAHIVSHNLRSHTSNFSMLLSFLNDEISEAEKHNIMGMLVDSSDNLLETINNLNEVVDINFNDGLEKKAISLKNKIQATEQSLSADILAANAKILNKVSEKVKVKVIPAYIDSILNNFITNSIKYRAQERTLIVTLTTKKEGPYTVLSITDNGLGIDLKKHGDKLFGMYKTFHDREDAKGIGLYITKNQIEAMNGKVTVTSEVGTGTTFNIYFNDED